MSHAMTLSPFSSAIRNASRTESRETTLEYVIELGASVIWPPATNLAFRVKSIFISNIIWHFISVYPISALPFRTSSILKSSLDSHATFTFRSSFSIARAQKSVPDSLSIWRASSAVCGSFIPNLCVVLQYLLFTLDTMRRRCRSISFTHHENAGSFSMWLATAYSATSIGLDALRSFRGIHSCSPPFHSTWSCHPLVVRFGTLFPFADTV
mmetsp:Transcript_33754/g.67002  ORF Transcript_33754/g.67002 Transcript_33754/m.67002 type:complete len:211 (+) Transcript_33754:74-706(+)